MNTLILQIQQQPFLKKKKLYQNILMAYYYNDLCNLLIRPTRQKYHLYDLGNPLLQNHGKRIDFQILSSLNLKLKCSFYTITQQNMSNPVVVYLHSFNGSRLQPMAYVQALMNKGFNVLTFDFRGCGISEGDYVTLGSRQKDDVLTIIRYMYRKWQCKLFAIWGRSMGAVTAIKFCKLLSDHKKKSNQLKQISIISLVLDSPFISLNRLAVQIAKKKISAPQFLLKVIFMMMKSTIQQKAHFDINNLELLPDLDSIKYPILILCSKKDSLISCQHSQQIYQSIKNSPQKQLVYLQSQHNQSRKQADLNKIYQFLSIQYDRSIMIKNNTSNSKIKNVFQSAVYMSNQRPAKSRSLLKNQNFHNSQSIDRVKLNHNGSCKDAAKFSFSKAISITNQFSIQTKQRKISTTSIDQKKVNKNEQQNNEKRPHLTTSKQIKNCEQIMQIQGAQNNQQNDNNYEHAYNSNNPKNSSKHLNREQNSSLSKLSKQINSYSNNNCNNGSSKKIFFGSSISNTISYQRQHKGSCQRQRQNQRQRQKSNQHHNYNNINSHNSQQFQFEQLHRQNTLNSKNQYQKQTTFKAFLSSIPQAQSLEKPLKQVPSDKNININVSSLKPAKKINKMKLQNDQEDDILRSEQQTKDEQCKQHLNVITAKLNKKKSTKKGLTKSFLPIDKLQFNRNHNIGSQNNQNNQTNNSVNNAHYFSSNSSPSYQTGPSSIQNRINYLNQMNLNLSQINSQNQQNIMQISQNRANLQKDRILQSYQNFNSTKTLRKDVNVKSTNFLNSNDYTTPAYQSSKILQNQTSNNHHHYDVSAKKSPNVFFNHNLIPNQQVFTCRHQVLKPQTPQTSNLRSHSRRSSVDIDMVQFSQNIPSKSPKILNLKPSNFISQSSKNIKLSGSLIQKQFVVSSKKSIDQHLSQKSQLQEGKKFLIARRAQNANYINNINQGSISQLNTSLNSYINNGNKNGNVSANANSKINSGRANTGSYIQNKNQKIQIKTSQFVDNNNNE